jgi:hypothetical protein
MTEDFRGQKKTKVLPLFSFVDPALAGESGRNG